jgi:hypothetical protein
MWKIYKDFNNHFTIDEDELEKAIYSFITGKPVVFKSGAAIRHIDSILPDYHAAMGWNEGYKLGALDHEELRQKGITTRLRGKYEEITTRVQYLIETRQENLIGKNIEIPALSAPEEPDRLELNAEIKRLSESKRM